MLSWNVIQVKSRLNITKTLNCSFEIFLKYLHLVKCRYFGRGNDFTAASGDVAWYYQRNRADYTRSQKISFIEHPSLYPNANVGIALLAEHVYLGGEHKIYWFQNHAVVNGSTTVF